MYNIYLKFNSAVRREHGYHEYVALQSQSYRSLKMSYLADKIWYEGPRGGIKVVKNRHSKLINGYITNDDAALKEFAWAKLAAVAV